MLNSISLMGRLTSVPERRSTAQGVPVTSFTIAVDRKYQRDETDFVDCVAWRNTAEFITQYFGKGQMIAIEGRLQIRRYQDKEGNNRRIAEVVAENAYFCGDRRSSTTEPEQQFDELDDSDGDLPF